MWSGRFAMFPRYYFFLVLLLLTCGYALWRGRSDERIVASVYAKLNVGGRMKRALFRIGSIFLLGAMD